MKCKYVELNQKEGKCHDYYYSHAKSHEGCMCRLKEWKKTIAVCPYDKTIFSVPASKPLIKDEQQKTL